MKVEVINTGTELLLGNVLNSHLAFFGRELFPLGLRIERQVTVPDGEAIRTALMESFGRAEIILVTGGLGPTTDDLTREIVSDLLGMELLHDDSVMSAIEARFKRRALQISERTRRQTMVPRGAIVLENPNGTAPGLYFNFTEHQACLPDFSVTRHLFLLPGPPRELKPMVFDCVIPILKSALPEGEIQECRTYRIAGLGESNVEALVGERLLEIAGLELGYCARPGEVDLRIIGMQPVLEKADVIVREVLLPHIVSQDNRSLEQVIVGKLIDRSETVAVAESCTGGFLANRITNVPGASQVFIEGFVTYANEAKVRELKVDADLIAKHGAVSEEVAAAMAEGAVRTTGSDYALSTTGIAGPGGAVPGKPVGTVLIALAFKQGETIVQRHQFPSDRENFKWLASQAALDLLRRNLPR